MEREDRYIVIKRSDASKHLTYEEEQLLKNLLVRVAEGRKEYGKHPMEAIVVENDWPEFELVWEMIELRCEGPEISESDTKTAAAAKFHGLENKPEEAMHWLERLTPGGSEFHNDPENCARLILDQRIHRHDALKRAVLAKKELEKKCMASHVDRERVPYSMSTQDVNLYARIEDIATNCSRRAKLLNEELVALDKGSDSETDKTTKYRLRIKEGVFSSIAAEIHQALRGWTRDATEGPEYGTKD